MNLGVASLAFSGTVDFEDTVARGLGDDSLLSRYTLYEVGGTSLTFGWDTSNDLLADQSLRFEDYNDGATETIGVLGYRLAGYSTQFLGETSSWDMDYSGLGGNYFIRANKEHGFNRTTGRMLISFTGETVTEFSALLNDLDHAEQFVITAYAADGSVLQTLNSASFTGVTPATQNGRGWAFTLGSAAASPMAYLAIEMTDDGTGGGFGLDNVSFIPAPASLACLAAAAFWSKGRRRRAC
ncbi:MAG: hypothetical protein O2800_06330 [Planctomycetota bacterium]|nr:hypothetical protein [Planctomycetota bacterium]